MALTRLALLVLAACPLLIWGHGLATREAVLAFQGRPDVPADAYQPLMEQLEAAAEARGVRLVALAGTDLEALDANVTQVLAQYPDAAVFYGGHGMAAGAGAIAVQGHAAQKVLGGKPPQGVVLLGGFLQRSWRPSVADCAAKWAQQPTHNCPKGKGLPFCPGGYLPEGVHACGGPAIPMPNYSLPSLTLGGDLDGIVRVSRIAEAWHTQTGTPQHAVVLVEGMNHLDLLRPSAAPSCLVARDLESELGPEAAQKKVADVVAEFLAAPAAFRTPNATAAAFKPFESMFVEQEGSWWWTSNSDESGSSHWAAEAQRSLCSPLPAGIDSWNASNEFRMLSDEDLIPPYYRSKHRPNITVGNGNRSAASRTVAQLRYIQLSVLQTAAGLNGWEIIKEEKTGVLSQPSFVDDGSAHVAASEIATKLASRQLLFERVGLETPVSLDDGDRCKDINMKAYELAKSAASKRAMERFNKSGRPLTFAKDAKPFPPAGPWWIWSYLQMKDKGEQGLEVGSYYAFYSLTGPAYGAGNHYCKLLSPAWALEWVYTDSLRKMSVKGLHASEPVRSVLVV